MEKKFYKVSDCIKESDNFHWSEMICEDGNCWNGKQERYIQIRRQYRKYKDFSGIIFKSFTLHLHVLSLMIKNDND